MIIAELRRDCKQLVGAGEGRVRAVMRRRHGLRHPSVKKKTYFCSDGQLPIKLHSCWKVYLLNVTATKACELTTHKFVSWYISMHPLFNWTLVLSFSHFVPLWLSSNKVESVWRCVCDYCITTFFNSTIIFISWYKVQMFRYNEVDMEHKT